MLPAMDGYSVCKTLRKESETEALPILMLTARGEPGERVYGLEIGADDYVTKPFSPRELVYQFRPCSGDLAPKRAPMRLMSTTSTSTRTNSMCGLRAVASS